MSRKTVVIAAGVLAVAAGALALRSAWRPRVLSVCVVTDYSFRNRHENWRDVLASRFAAAERAFRGTGVRWDFRDADQPDPTSDLASIEERRQKLIRAECDADVILGITALAGARSDVPPFAHTAIVADSASLSDAQNSAIFVQGLAALFGGTAKLASGEALAKSDAELVRRLRDYDFAKGAAPLEGSAAERVFDALRKSFPAGDARHILGIALAADSRFPGAIRQFQERVKLDPSNAAAHIELATAYTHNFDYAQAVAEYRAAVTCKPTDAPTHAGLALALANAGLGEDALDEFREALRLDPKFASAQAGLAYVLTQQPGRIDEAIVAYETALQMAPQLPAAMDGLERAKSLKAKADEELGEKRRKAQAAPSDAQAHFELGLTEARAGDVAAAVRELRRAVELEPGHALAHEQLALLLYRQGDYASALREAQTASGGGYAPPRDVVERLKRKAGA